MIRDTTREVGDEHVPEEIGNKDIKRHFDVVSHQVVVYGPLSMDPIKVGYVMVMHGVMSSLRSCDMDGVMS